MWGANREFITTTAFHKLRDEKKRMFRLYCRGRLTSLAGELRPSYHKHAADEEDGKVVEGGHWYENLRKKDVQEVRRLTEELKEVRSELDKLTGKGFSSNDLLGKFRSIGFRKHAQKLKA